MDGRLLMSQPPARPLPPPGSRLLPTPPTQKPSVSSRHYSTPACPWRKFRFSRPRLIYHHSLTRKPSCLCSYERAANQKQLHNKYSAREKELDGENNTTKQASPRPPHPPPAHPTPPGLPTTPSKVKLYEYAGDRGRYISAKGSKRATLTDGIRSSRDTRA